MYSSFLKIRSPCYSSVRLKRLIDFPFLHYFRCHNFNGYLQFGFFNWHPHTMITNHPLASNCRPTSCPAVLTENL